jgi:pectate lyase
VEVYQNRYFEIRPYAGGYIGIPLKANVKIKDNYFSISVDNKSLDLGIESGVNIGFKLNDQYKINFIPRMQFGLSNIYQEYYYEKRRNIAFSIGLGLIRKI